MQRTKSIKQNGLSHVAAALNFTYVWCESPKSYRITRQKRFGGENQFKSQSESPPKPPWRGKTSADSTRFPVKTILAGNTATNANPIPDYHIAKPQRKSRDARGHFSSFFVVIQFVENRLHPFKGAVLLIPQRLQFQLGIFNICTQMMLFMAVAADGYYLAAQVLVQP